MSSFAAKFLLIFCAANCLLQVESKSIFGIGTRIIGDQLLMKDILKTPSITLTEEPVIKFNYAIQQPITYIEMISENNIYGAVDFSYENDLVEGTIRKVKPGIVSGLNRSPDAFEVLIQIYGLNDTLLNVNPAYILNKDQQFNGILRPQNDIRLPRESLNLMEEDSVIVDHLDDEEFDMDDDDDTGGYIDEDDDYSEYDFNPKMNKVIELGDRQEGDALLYETYQTSADATETPENHTVVFYYIDSNFVTFVKFTIYDHYLDNPLSNYKPPTIEFEKISPHTLKAIVTDQHTTSLFVQMQIYGFRPNDKPVAFHSYLTSGQATRTASSSDVADDADVENVTIQLPLTKKRRMKVRFVAQQQTDNQPQNEHVNVERKMDEGEERMPNGNAPLASTMMTLAVAMIWRQILN